MRASYFRSESGNITIIASLSMAVLTGVAGIATIYVQSLNAKERVQASLDAAVLSATAMTTGTSDEERIATAKSVFDANMRNAVVGANAEITISETPTFLVNATEVAGSAKGIVRNSLGAALNIEEMDIFVDARAKKMSSEPLCILSLNRTEPASIEIYGNAHINAIDCPVQANSSSDEGLKLYGNQSSATASKFGVTGDFSGGNWSPRPTTGTEPLSDPYASLPVPEPGTCIDIGNKLTKSNYALDPGTYCGGLTIGGGADVRLKPGIYIMKDGRFSVGSGAVVTGQNVMIAFVGADSYLHLQSGSETTLTSPQSGIYANIQFMSDRDLSQSKFEQEWTTILSGATLNYDGVMYLPEQQLWAGGTGHNIIIKANSPSLAIVVDKMWAQGNVVIEVTQEDRRGLGEVTQAPGIAWGAMLSE